jgi:GAF domain-containing protein
MPERKKQEYQMQQLIRTLRAMQNSSLLMVNATDEYKFLQDVCDIIVKDCGYLMAWIGYKQLDAAKSVKPEAYAGFEENYLRKVKISWEDNEWGRGPAGTTIRTGKTTFSNIQTDPDFKRWRKEALKRGYSSLIALPLFMDEEVFGALVIYSNEPYPFSDDEQQLLSKMAHDLSYGIKAIRLNLALQQAKENLEVRVRQRTSLLKKTIDNLAAEKQRFQDVLNMIPAYVALINPDHEITFTNNENGRQQHHAEPYRAVQARFSVKIIYPQNGRSRKACF